jgi:hypothetical protein
LIIPGSEIDVSEVKHKKSWMNMPKYKKAKPEEEKEA